MNGKYATLTGLATAHTGSRAQGGKPNTPVGGTFGLILAAAAGTALGRSGAPTR